MPSLPHLPRHGEAGVAARQSSTRIVYFIIALSGLSTMGAEVVWTRLLSLLLGGTVYTFSIILAVFLGGLAIGSGLGSADRLKTLRKALAVTK